MSILWIERTNIDSDKWNRCVLSCPQTDTVFAQLWYIDTCCDEWDALVEDDYRAVWPLCHRRKFGISYIFPPFFVAQIGILGNPRSEISEWMDAIPKKFLKIEVLFNARNTLPQSLQQHAFCHRTFLLELSPAYENLRARYHQNQLRNLKKAENSGLQIVRETTTEEVIGMFRQNRGKQKNVGFKTADYQRLTQLISLLDTHQTLENWGAVDAGGNLCAAAFFTRWNKRYTFLFSGRSTVSDSNRAMFFLMDRFIQAHAGENALLDFNGSNNEAVARFYRGFGAEESRFFQVNTSFLRNKK